MSDEYRLGLKTHQPRYDDGTPIPKTNTAFYEPDDQTVVGKRTGDPETKEEVLEDIFRLVAVKASYDIAMALARIPKVEVETSNHTLDGQPVYQVGGCVSASEIREMLNNAWTENEYIAAAQKEVLAFLEDELKPEIWELGYPGQGGTSATCGERLDVIHRVREYVMEDLQELGYPIVATFTNPVTGKTARNAVLPIH